LSAAASVNYLYNKMSNSNNNGSIIDFIDNVLSNSNSSILQELYPKYITIKESNKICDIIDFLNNIDSRFSLALVAELYDDYYIAQEEVNTNKATKIVLFNFIKNNYINNIDDNDNNDCSGVNKYKCFQCIKDLVNNGYDFSKAEIKKRIFIINGIYHKKYFGFS
jgi:hypothetical protein